MHQLLDSLADYAEQIVISTLANSPFVKVLTVESTDRTDESKR